MKVRLNKCKFKGGTIKKNLIYEIKLTIPFSEIGKVVKLILFMNAIDLKLRTKTQGLGKFTIDKIILDSDLESEIRFHALIEDVTADLKEFGEPFDMIIEKVVDDV